MTPSLTKGLGTALAFCLLCLFCGPAWGQENPVLEWKVGTIAPRGMGWSKLMEKHVIPKVYKATEGKFRYKIYWGGIQGNNEDMVRKMRSGELDAVGLDGQGTVLAVNEFAVLELPFLFRDYGEVDHIRDRMFPVFADLAKKNGFYLFMWADQDFDQIYSTKRRMASLADFRQSRFINWNGLLEKKLFKKIGASSVPKRISDIQPAIRNQEGDAGIAPAMWILGIQAHAVLRYVNPIKIRYSPAVLFSNIDAWQKIPEPNREKIIAMRPELTQAFIRATRNDNLRALSAMVQYGIRPVDMDSRELEALKTATRPLWDDMSGILFSRQLLDQVQDQLRDYRSRKGN